MKRGKAFKEEFPLSKAIRNTRRTTIVLRGALVIRAGGSLGIAVKIKEKLIRGRPREGKKEEKK